MGKHSVLKMWMLILERIVYHIQDLSLLGYGDLTVFLHLFDST